MKHSKSEIFKAKWKLFRSRLNSMKLFSNNPIFIIAGIFNVKITAVLVEGYKGLFIKKIAVALIPRQYKLVVNDIAYTLRM